MLTHKSIWAAIDALAAEHGLSVSGLARRSGLDPTTFNKSKRVSRDEKPRWPSTESVAKILDATGASLPDLVSHIAMTGDGLRLGGRRIPIVRLDQAGGQGFFDDTGFPLSGDWDQVDFPEIADADAYAVEIVDDTMAPTLRRGDMAIASPTAGVRRGDRVIVRTVAGEVMARELARRTATRVELRLADPAQPPVSLDTRDVAWVSRIIWIGQT
ncbi:MAG: helix-turn-helix transcriptional regulator [Alphaproteobacteria bacterium]|jgi:phage repressor protein C with HTH and peptisase S24 domain|nr:helix-turn-helix transcriptional regulator [Alphaproteobacteria bacterium]MDP6564467.1 helix-turn-helix transcriptional regulator [Alphaproteobacteria bacterium]MDP6815811.1 helix-turn-helix transcriptional regulator [Alphaproteobacteria bacterium]